tara:strand:- start:5 stop:550 length:546 start_codon:yes stop_codon:yes gene_type:complete
MTSKLKVNLINDAGDNNLITSDGSGNLTTQKILYPAFEAHLSSDQTSIADNTYTKVNANTEIFDTDSAYDNLTNYRFVIPTGKSGKYYVYGSISCQLGSSTELINSYAAIYKNGSKYKENRRDFTANYIDDDSVQVFATLDLSSGDYIELFGAINTVSSGTSRFFGSESKRTTFGAFRIGS